VRLTQLSVRGPLRSSVLVHCDGRNCPRRARARIGRKRSIAFRTFRRRFQPGTVITVRVWKKNRIGKYTRFRIRRGKRPARRDTCLNPRTLKPRNCP
jgi:hypothetical protein